MVIMMMMMLTLKESHEVSGDLPWRIRFFAIGAGCSSNYRR